MTKTKQLTVEEAVAFHDSEDWKQMTNAEIAMFQIHQKRLCIPFEVFHKAVQETINRPVFSHEFGLNVDGLREEIKAATKSY